MTALDRTRVDSLRASMPPNWSPKRTHSPRVDTSNSQSILRTRRRSLMLDAAQGGEGRFFGLNSQDSKRCMVLSCYRKGSLRYHQGSMTRPSPLG